MNDLFQAAAELQSFCDGRGWQSCFIGGIAVQRWGETRATRDVDLCLLTGFGREAEFANELLSVYRQRIADALEFALRNRVLLLETRNAIGIDVSLAGLPFEEDVIARASLFRFGPGLDIRTCSAEDLVILKLFALRPLDVRDAEGVAIRHGRTLDWERIEAQLTWLSEVKEEPRILTEMARIRELGLSS
ncbi:MAG: hypothetical protein HY820_26535 [Acidobacteria bacterium]|nr:hypothetical protein [Acidobacteriota bacterium]